jgi:hypothetical protein
MRARVNMRHFWRALISDSDVILMEIVFDFVKDENYSTFIVDVA